MQASALNFFLLVVSDLLLPSSRRQAFPWACFYSQVQKSVFKARETNALKGKLSHCMYIHTCTHGPMCWLEFSRIKKPHVQSCFPTFHAMLRLATYLAVFTCGPAAGTFCYPVGLWGFPDGAMWRQPRANSSQATFHSFPSCRHVAVFFSWGNQEYWTSWSWKSTDFISFNPKADVGISSHGWLENALCYVLKNGWVATWTRHSFRKEGITVVSFNFSPSTWQLVSMLSLLITNLGLHFTH